MMYWRRPLTRLECALYASVFALLVGFFVERGFYYMELAERAAVEVTVSRVNSGLMGRLATDLVAGRPGGRQPPEGNPFQLARMAPANFRGEVEGVDEAALERGIWVFDRSRNEVVYRPQLSRRLDTGTDSRALHFRLVRSPTHGALMLVPTSPYRWE